MQWANRWLQSNFHTKNLNPKAAEFVPRTRTPRKAKETATNQINAIGLYEDEEN